MTGPFLTTRPMADPGDEAKVFRMARAMDAWTLAEAGWAPAAILKAMEDVPTASVQSLNLARVALSALKAEA